MQLTMMDLGGLVPNGAPGWYREFYGPDYSASIRELVRDIPQEHPEWLVQMAGALEAAFLWDIANFGWGHILGVLPTYEAYAECIEPANLALVLGHMAGAAMDADLIATIASVSTRNGRAASYVFHACTAMKNLLQHVNTASRAPTQFTRGIGTKHAANAGAQVAAMANAALAVKVDATVDTVPLEIESLSAAMMKLRELAASALNEYDRSHSPKAS